MSGLSNHQPDVTGIALPLRQGKIIFALMPEEDFYQPELDRKTIDRTNVCFNDFVVCLVGVDGKGGINEVLRRFIETDESRFGTPVIKRLDELIAVAENMKRRVADKRLKLNQALRDT
jgi:hypothetical protein